MPRIIITEGATQGLERCRLFLAEKSPLAAARAARAIAQQFELLETEPEIGRPWEEFPQLRELLIPFGDSGFVALYRYEPNDNALYVLAFRHQKEAGY
ncbi:type II toxin-antitoxin system RelE/ParE family toxin [Methylotuvimicrobium alcaliphilum]|uniref:Plasmid stabilization system n=1 Tax=Methylotuvimicrobium alcaliphilum (strain DSM 19304 / NCIMB 14124 / VKM B-2133 / 20Z) TaxID=1091494 RepID=G4T4N9_META2|nr:type II toxin-antitoxin system RelE/ParE family toxin [Methylotuvimicrobium alcaliphilum]CCE25795.1 Plasmid stabilization system [Methylotuvimicrobium alcaliphilum 20Z]